MALNRLLEFLDDQGVEYVVISHSKAYTAQKIAASAHIPGNEVAKTVILKLDGKMVMAVLQAPKKVDLQKIREVTGAKIVELAAEEEFGSKFPDCEVGAMPPFGNLYDMRVLVDKGLTDDERIAFNGCSHRDLVQLNYKDFEHLINPQIAEISL